MAMESKKEIYDLIPSQYIPKTIYIKKGTGFSEIVHMVNEEGIKWPFIAKPDIGMKALGVDKLHTKDELKTYMKKISGDFLIQELIDFPNEVGLFYVRFPGNPKGIITGIVEKEFLTVEGNGNDTILHLIKQNPRSYLQLASLKRKYGNYLNAVLQVGEKFILVPFGSHTRGAKFVDVSFKLNDNLFQTINDICIQIPGFYFGRLDIRFESFDDLSQGKNFSIIELNGAGSEPTFIYDPEHSLFFAWKEIIKHWKLLYLISSMNFLKGHSYLSFRDGAEMMHANHKLEVHLRLM